MVPNEVGDKISDKFRAHWDSGEIIGITAVVALYAYLNRWDDWIGSVLENLPIQADGKHLKEAGWQVGKHK